MIPGPLVVLTRGPNEAGWRVELATQLPPSVERLGEVFELSTEEGTHEVVAFQANEATPRSTWPDAVMKAIEAMRANDTPQARSVLADTLEESGELAAAEYVRLDEALQHVVPVGRDFVERVRTLRRLGTVTGPTFRYLVGRDIEGCAGVRWTFRCPRRWDSMQATSDASQRVCQSCRQVVIQVPDGAEAARLAADGVCVSIQGAADPERFEGEVAAEPDDGPTWRPAGSVSSMPSVPPAPVAVVRPRPPAPWWKRLFGGTKR